MSSHGTGTSGVWAAPRAVNDLGECMFYHTMDVPGHGHVEGQWDLREGVGPYLGHVDLRGKRVLELGTADGFLTFEMERRGAEVVSYDLSEDFRWDVVPYARAALVAGRQGDDAAWVAGEESYRGGIRRLNNAYWLCHRAFGSGARAVYGTVYAVPAEIGEVDVTTFGAILLHTRDPFAALTSALRLTRETVIVTEPKERLSLPPAVAALRNRLPRRFRRPYMRFNPDWRTGQDPDGWWRLTPELVVDFVGVLGFERTEVTHHTQVYRGRPRRMFTVVGHRTVG
jgi:hypothetical protein